MPRTNDRWRRFALGLLAMFATGCLVGEDVRQAVEEHCPGCELRDWRVGEGDGDHAYVHLKLECGGDDELRERVWLFQRRGWDWRALCSPANTRC